MYTLSVDICVCFHPIMCELTCLSPDVDSKAYMEMGHAVLQEMTLWHCDETD